MALLLFTAIQFAIWAARANSLITENIQVINQLKPIKLYNSYSCAFVGAPSEQQTYEYAKTILSLMTQEKHPQGKVLITGGGIANFTNVAATFRGIITALQEFQQRMIDHKISIFVRRAGPNYQEGLRRMREVGQTLGNYKTNFYCITISASV